MKLLLTMALGALCLSVNGQETPRLNFQEVYSVVRTNLTDISEEELSHAAAAGLIRELGTKVQLVTNNASAPERPEEAITRRAVYNDEYGYIQVRNLDDRLPAEFQEAVARLNTNNALRGLVVDLRYAQGEGYQAAAKVADQFLKGGEPLIKIGTNAVRSTDKSKPLDLPLAALVNKETRGAAEALAALFRESGTGLIIGSPTAGEARLFETVTLGTGQQLRIGRVPVEVGEGKILPSKGISPDVVVLVTPASEKILYQDPYRPITANASQRAGGSTNEVTAIAPRARRFNEAELVRRHRAGESLDDEGVAGAADPGDRPVINDPVLARALDFLKGISVLQQHRPL